MPLAASAQEPTTLSQVVDKIVAQEQVEMQMLHQYSPLVETYIQTLRPDKRLGSVPEGDKYFLGRAELAKGVELEPLTSGAGNKRSVFGGLGGFFSMEFLPQGFLQMIYIDMYGFDRGHYKFDYIRREFLGDVRCLVFDINPVKKNDKGRFVGRIWVEDRDFHIVRFNGAYGGSSLISNYFNFDSWRTNAGKNQWLPAFVYSQQGDVQDPQTKRIGFKPFRAQTRLWGYDLGHASEEQELTKILIETPVKDQAETTGEGARRQQTSEVCDLKPAGPQVGGGEANEADVDSKGLKRTAHAISFAFNMIAPLSLKSFVVNVRRVTISL